MAFSVLMHWLTSRSLFLVRILVFNHKGLPEPDRNISACGCSPLAILTVLIILMVMMVALLGFRYRSLAKGAPTVGTCSWAVSAACHQTVYDEHAAAKSLK